MIKKITIIDGRKFEKLIPEEMGRRSTNILIDLYMLFERKYIVMVNVPSIGMHECEFNDPNEMRAYTLKMHKEFRNGDFHADTVIKYNIVEISMAGEVYESLAAIEYEEEQIEDYYEDFYDEYEDYEDEFGNLPRRLSIWAIESLLDHVMRINEFNKGAIWKDHIIELLKSYKYSSEEMTSFYLREQNKTRYKPTELFTLNFEDGSRLYVVNPKNLQIQEQGFNASLILWNGKEYVL